MKLIDILMPKPEDISIQCEKKLKIFVQNYTNINIDFSLRSEYLKDGSYRQTEYPFVTYTIDLDKQDKKNLYSLFKNDRHLCLLQEKQCIIFFKKKYKFKAKLKVIPSILLDKKYLNSEYNKIKLELNLKEIDKKNLHKDIKIVYKKYEKKTFNRFEIMDI